MESSSESDADEQPMGLNPEPSNEETEEHSNKTSDEDEKSLDGEERSKIRSELSTMPFEELMKLKEKLGSKIYNEAIFGNSSTVKERNPKTKVELKRLNKNRPREMGSKRPVPLLGGEERRSKKIDESAVRDPRFDEKCGEYNTKIFKDNYSFITDIRSSEIDELNKKLRNSTTEEETDNLKFLIQRLKNQNREENTRKIKEDVIKEEIKEINKAKREGKPVHYSTKKERRTKELVKQYESLKSSGRLEKHLEKQRKKNTAKDRKKYTFD